MHVIASFDLSIKLEMAIAELEEYGIQKDHIFALPLKKRNKRGFFDTMHHSDGKALFDGVALWGGFFCALGTIYGFVLPWGPVLWGLIGFIGGSTFGFIIKVVAMKLYRRNNVQKATTEVFLMVDCENHMVHTVEQILWNQNAFGVATAP